MEGGALKLGIANSWGSENAASRRNAGCLALSFALLLLFAAQAHAALYIGSGGTIARANLDGSLLDARYIETGGGSTCAIAVDSSHIYWTDSAGDKVGRANLDGTGIDNNFITLTKWTVPCGLAVDSNFIYWSGMGTDMIGRARLDGSEVDESFIPTVEHPCAVAVNQTGIYWGSDVEDSIWRTDIAGVNGPEVVIDEHATEPCGIALAGPDLFWADSDTGAIGRAKLDGSGALPELITGGHSPVSLAIHVRHLFWVNAAWGVESIGRADVEGGNVDQAFLGGIQYPYSLAVDSVVVTPPPVTPPVEPSALKFGKLRRQPDGSVVFPVDLFGEGWLEARVLGATVKIDHERVEKGVTLPAGRTWLSVAPTPKRGDGSRCVLRAFRRGARVRLSMRLGFTERGKGFVVRSRGFVLYKPRRVEGANTKRRGRLVSCLR